MEKMISTLSREFYFNGRMVAPGELFESEDRYVPALTAAQSARKATEDEVQAAASKTSRRRYSRRDMQAEGT